MIYTIGYSKWTIDQLLKVMQEKEIDLLVDLRSVPFGRFTPPLTARTLPTSSGPFTSGRATSWAASTARPRTRALTG